MESQATFVWPDGTVHLDAEPAVHVHLTLIILPGHPKHDHPFGLDDSLDNLFFTEFRMLIENQRQRFDHLLHRLVKFGFRRVLRLNPAHQICDVALH